MERVEQQSEGPVGTHTVRVVHEHCPAGREYEAAVGPKDGRLAILMADIDDESTCRVVLW